MSLDIDSVISSGTLKDEALLFGDNAGIVERIKAKKMQRVEVRERWLNKKSTKFVVRYQPKPIFTY